MNARSTTIPAVDRWRLLALMMVALVFRFGAIEWRSGLGVTPPSGREYIHVGQRLLTFGTQVTPLTHEARADHWTSGPSCVMPPLYGAIVAGVYQVLGVESFAATFVLHGINAAATSLAVLVVFVVAIRIADRRAAWIAAVLCALNPVIAGYADWIWDTSLFALGVILAVCFAQRLSQQRVTAWRGLAFGAYLGILAQLNPALTTAYPLLVLWAVTQSSGWRCRPLAVGVAACVVGWLVAITPWTIRNHTHFDQFIYIRGGGGMDLWLAACPEAEGSRHHTFDAHFPLKNDEVHQELWEVGERTFLADRRAKAIQSISEQPGRFTWLAAQRGVCYWTGLFYPHYAGESPWPEGPVRSAITLFLLLELTLLAIGYLVARPLPTDIRWLIGMLVVFSMTYCIFHVQIRFRMPIEPILAVVIGTMLARIRWTRSVDQEDHKRP